LERTQFAYPILLASFPFYYFAFAIYDGNFVALYKEIALGFIFFALVSIAITSKRKTSAALIGIGCILHAVYDAFHNMLFINAGTPSWWLEFCGSIDLILGVYLLYFAITMPNKSFENAAQDSSCSDAA
jgi:hypothetical protein